MSFLASERNVIMRELQIPQIPEFIEQYRRNYKKDVNKMKWQKSEKRY